MLSAVEPLIDYQHYDEYLKRVMGFLAERLLNIYILKNRIRAKHFNFYFYGDQEDSRNPIKKFLTAVRGFLYVCKTSVVMFILNVSLNRLLRKLLKKSPKKP